MTAPSPHRSDDQASGMAPAPQDALIARYHEASALLGEGPDPALRERVLARAESQARLRGTSADVSVKHRPAANDVRWLRHAMAALGVVGVAAALLLRHLDAPEPSIEVAQLETPAPSESAPPPPPTESAAAAVSSEEGAAASQGPALTPEEKPPTAVTAATSPPQAADEPAPQAEVVAMAEAQRPATMADRTPDNRTARAPRQHPVPTAGHQTPATPTAPVVTAGTEPPQGAEHADTTRLAMEPAPTADGHRRDEWVVAAAPPLKENEVEMPRLRRGAAAPREDEANLAPWEEAVPASKTSTEKAPAHAGHRAERSPDLPMITEAAAPPSLPPPGPTPAPEPTPAAPAREDRSRHAAARAVAPEPTTIQPRAAQPSPADAPASKHARLMLAVRSGQVHAATQAVQQGAPINGKDVQGHTALMRAAEQGDLAMVQTLLKLGADTRARNPQGQTAANLAAAHGHLAVVQVLQSPPQ